MYRPKRAKATEARALLANFSAMKRPAVDVAKIKTLAKLPKKNCIIFAHAHRAYHHFSDGVHYIFNMNDYAAYTGMDGDLPDDGLRHLGPEIGVQRPLLVRKNWPGEDPRQGQGLCSVMSNCYMDIIAEHGFAAGLLYLQTQSYKKILPQL